MFKLLARVHDLERQGRNIVHFEIGDPDFPTPKSIVNSAYKALKDNQTHYVDSMGTYDFRQAICDTTEISRGFRPDMEQVLITPGANIIVYYTVRCLVDPGDDVILPNPCFPTYNSVLEFCQVNPVYVPIREENEFRMDPDDIKAKITDRTRLIIINSPHNPCGSVLTKKQLDGIYDIAEENDIYVFSDEVYSRMIYDYSNDFYSLASRDKCRKRTILANGFSKAFAMTGWRLGCVIAPAEVTNKMALLLQTTSSCVTPFIQKAGIEAIKGSHKAVSKMMEIYRKRRAIVVDGLNSLPGIKCLNPGGAFYAFPNIKGTGTDDITFADNILNKASVALLPGSCFGESGAGYIRICYATNERNIETGIERMRSYLEGKTGDQSY